MQGGLNAINSLTTLVDVTVAQPSFKGLGNNTITALTYSDNQVYLGSEKGLYRYNVFDKTVHSCSIPLSIAPFIDQVVVSGPYLLLFIRNLGCVSYDTRRDIIADTVTTKEACGVTQQRFYAVSHYTDNQWLIGTTAGIHALTVRPDGRLLFEPRPFPYALSSLQKDVYALAVDTNQHIWFSTESQLFSIDPVKQQYYQIENGLASGSNVLNNVYKIYCDRQNNIWLGCQGGLFFLNNRPAPTITFFRSSNSFTEIAHTYYIFPCNDSILLVTAENGLYEVNTHTHAIRELDNTQPYDFVFRDPSGCILVSNKHGVQLKTGAGVKPVSTAYPEFAPYAGVTINSAVQVNSQEIAMGTENEQGVLLWNFVQHTIRLVTTHTSPLQLDNNIVNTVFKLRDNVFCVLTESSLIRIDLARGTSRRIHFPKANPLEEYALFFDICRIKNQYYLSSYGNGVLVLDTSFTVKKIISQANGLSNNSVYKLLPWKDSLLIMTTNYGLNIMEVQSGRIRRFFKEDGLHDNVFEETSGTLHKDVVYVGGLNGFTALYPENLRINNTPPPLFIDQLSIEMPGQVRQDTTHLAGKYFVIPDDALQATITLSGINYAHPARTVFAYRIQELHKDWIQLGPQHFISLLGIPPGTYHIWLKAANEDGFWSTPRVVVLSFTPKWYQTWLFKWLLFATALVLAWLFYRYRIAQLNKLHDVRKSMAADLHDNLGSTLSSIKLFTNMALAGMQQHVNLENIRESVSLATIGLRDMIWVLDDSLDTVDELVIRLRQFAMPLAAASGTTIDIKASYETQAIQLSKKAKQNFFLVCKEAINNSIKYAEATSIVVDIRLNGRRVLITVTDDGKGFAQDTIKRGYGLNNMEYRMRQINYGASIVSSPGHGTQISIYPL